MNNPDVLVCYVDSAVYKVIKETVKSCFFDAETWIRILCNPIPPDEDDPDLTKYLKFKKAWFLLIPDQPTPRLETNIEKLLYHPDDHGDGQLELFFSAIKEEAPER